MPMRDLRVLDDLGELRQLFQELWPDQTFEHGHCVRCPFHADHEPSLSFYLATDGKVRYHCFGCQAHGDACDAVMQAKGVGFAEAAAFLAAREGTDVSSLMPHLQANRHEQAWLNTLAAYLRECLHHHSRGDRVRAWLTQRGVPQDTWARLPIGLYPSGPEVARYCREQGMA